MLKIRSLEVPDKMNRERKERLRKNLLELKRKLWAELREEYFKKLGEEYSEQFHIPQDTEDLSLLDLIEDTGLTIADIHRERLTQLEEALRKLEEGTYGVCDECGREIDEERLRVMPLATLCVECQRKRESS